jgi:hypothetical protein
METADTTSEYELIDERRREPRKRFVAEGQLHAEHKGSAGPRRILLKDISSLGVGFETELPIEPGARCRIVIELGPSRIQWRLRIVCCGRIDDNLYRIGCEFLPAERDLFDLSEEDLNLGDPQEVLILQ